MHDSSVSTGRVSGLAFALSAYVIWGLFPLYFKQLGQVDPVEVLAHRIIWTVPLAALIVLLAAQWGSALAAFRDMRQLRVLGFSAVLIAINWGVYIWAVLHDRILEASLGYYLTPLVSVALGIVVFGERLRPLQWCAIGLAAVGVLQLLIHDGIVPWVGLAVAFSFGLYGALRKQATVGSASGLFVETVLLVPLALLWVGWLWQGGEHSFTPATDPLSSLLLVGAGAMTAVPLMLFVAGTKRLQLSTIGVLFYLTPTLQFLLATLFYDEPLGTAGLIAFVCIWIGLAIHFLEGRAHENRRRRRGGQAAATPAD